MGKDGECLGCGQKFEQKDAYVQCNICGLWAHKTCSGLSNEFFNCLAEQIKNTVFGYWACRSCSNYAAGMNHRLKEVQQLVQEAISLAKENSKETKFGEQDGEAGGKGGEETGAGGNRYLLYEEMSMREEKRKNVVVHGLVEPNGEDGWARMEEDRKKLNKIFTVLDINVAVETDVEFCRRIGEKSERARPLVVGFYNEWAKQCCGSELIFFGF
jgi:hypothetical protein